MALVSGRRSTLNPDAPLFIPAALRQVEDFSPEWWQLITTSTWYHDYWVSQHQDEDGFYDNAEDEFDVSNIADLLPDTFDLDAGEDFSAIEAQFDEFVMAQHVQSPLPADGLAKDAEALVKNVNSGEISQVVFNGSCEICREGTQECEPKIQPSPHPATPLKRAKLQWRALVCVYPTDISRE
ncbi:hypothetical protein Dsin_011936 [Dipteronia sinensis]|uniref:Uncharacterized protein n=1 Tax=Dipteronia sinensis TaxID=43782 RepID=A0AAE0AHB4_9ROSI|nr:hypothetical protein Dsin_011936 [Dipteronia sinensis]